MGGTYSPDLHESHLSGAFLEFLLIRETILQPRYHYELGSDFTAAEQLISRRGSLPSPSPHRSLFTALAIREQVSGRAWAALPQGAVSHSSLERLAESLTRLNRRPRAGQSGGCVPPPHLRVL